MLFKKCKSLLMEYGLGVILSHRNDRKEEFPIAFVSRTLTEAEKRFSQLEKKALSITFGVEKFRQYLLGRKFVLVTDNRPLIHIFSPHKPIPICASSRIKIWSLKLAAFNYTVEFRKTSDNSNVDALSRLESSVRESLDEDQVLLLRKLNEIPFSFMEVANETPQDKILCIVLRNVREGNCWPGIDSNIEELTRECRVCQESASMPPATISEWTWPEKPWHRLHLDLADNGRQFVFGEFEQFTKMNGIRHIKTSPYNPSTNGLAERYVREFKNFLRNNNGKDDLETNLQRFLFAHRAFPQTVIKEFPGGTANEEKFKIKILEFNTKMGNPREVFHEAVRRQEQFTTGCEVYFRNYATGPKREEEVPEVTSGNKEETASVHVPSCTPIPGPVAVHVPSCTPKPEAAAVQVPVRSPRPQRAREPLDRLEEDNSLTSPARQGSETRPEEIPVRDQSPSIRTRYGRITWKSKTLDLYGTITWILPNEGEKL
ncbi:K02A2.6-like [Cordylochernes scorpioides]|uniref:K02A2.6-like n=1 Tax=Cordylochernes scorpioides TaxID=51811 RepID=A0ABY6LSU3_9ARAC|nr:K02A2.6-like [Cordylochernes scorpioides]